MPKLSKVDELRKVSATEALRRKNVALAGLRELELQKKRGEVLDAQEVRFSWTEVGSAFRNTLLSFPSRVCNRLPIELRGQVGHVVEEEARAALTGLSEMVKSGNYKPALEVHS
jgi:phage terminase Nu1 subunit (DNA packaging protein)